MLTHWGRDKMAGILQMTLSNAFSWMEILNFDWNFTEVCSQGSNYLYSNIGSDNGLAPTRRQAIIWNNDTYITDAYMRHSASISLFCTLINFIFHDPSPPTPLFLSGLHLNILRCPTSMRIPIIKVRLLWQSYLYNENPFIWKYGLYIETGPWCSLST